jgi:hypothetical protein
MRMAVLTSSIGLCAIPLCAWAGVSLYQGGAAAQTVTPFAVERTNKTDRRVGAVNRRGEYVPAISVEVAGKSDAVVTVRDRGGRILYRLDPAERVTIVAKRMTQKPAVPRLSGHEVAPPQPAPSDVTRELPDGCEVGPRTFPQQLTTPQRPRRPDRAAKSPSQNFIKDCRAFAA